MGSISVLAAKTSRGAWYALALLNIAYLVAFFDRIVLSLLLIPLQSDFSLSDTQLGMLSGIAFGLFYSILGLPAGHLADRINRRDLIVGGMLLWSAATIACGFTQGFIALFVFRMAVGVGEAVLHPAATSMITDLFRPEQRARAMGVYLMAGAAATMIAMLIGGPLVRLFEMTPGLSFPIVGELRVWQATFIAAGFPGVVLAIVLRFTMVEPDRVFSGNEKRDPMGWREVGQFLGENRRAMSCHIIGVPVSLMGSLALISWLPVYFQRVHDWHVGQTAVAYAFTGGITAIAGALLVGFVPPWLRRRGHSDATFRTCLFGGLWLNGFGVLAMLSAQPWVAMGFIALSAFVTMVPAITALTCVGEIAPNRIRGRVAALYAVATGIIANALSAFLVGLMSQHLFDGPTSIRDALLVMFSFSLVVGGGIVAYGLPAYRRTMDRQAAV